MTAVFWKELRELRYAAVVAALLATTFGLALGSKLGREISLLFVALGLLGIVVGAWQAVLDRLAARDQFLMHRPVSAARLHVARTFAGAAVLVAAVAATFAVGAYMAYRAKFDSEGRPLPDFHTLTWWRDGTSGRAAFAVLLAFTMQAVTRLGGNAGRPLVAVVLAPAAPFLLVLALGRSPGVAVPTAVAVAAGVVAAGLSFADAVERRSTGRS